MCLADTYSQNIVLAVQTERVASKHKVYLGQVGYGVAVDDVLTPHDGGGADGLIDGFGFSQRPGDQAGAGVGDSLAPIFAKLLLSNLDSVHFDLPVGLAVDRQIGEVSLVMGGVGASKDYFATLLCGRVPRIGKYPQYLAKEVVH